MNIILNVIISGVYAIGIFFQAFYWTTLGKCHRDGGKLEMHTNGKEYCVICGEGN